MIFFRLTFPERWQGDATPRNLVLLGSELEGPCEATILVATHSTSEKKNRHGMTIENKNINMRQAK
jgi:hypothetical protein